MLLDQRVTLPLRLLAERLGAISQEIVSKLREAGVPLKRIEHTPNGVEIPTASAVPRQKDDELRLIFVGRLVPGMGVIPELVEHERTGLLAPPEDASALANALARLLDDAALRAALARASRAKVVADFEIEKNTQALLRVFNLELGQSLGQADPKPAPENPPLPEVVC